MDFGKQNMILKPILCFNSAQLSYNLLRQENTHHVLRSISICSMSDIPQCHTTSSHIQQYPNWQLNSIFKWYFNTVLKVFENAKVKLARGTKFGYLMSCPLIVVLTALNLRTDKNCLTKYYNANVCEIVLYLSLEALVGSGLLLEFFTEALAPSSDDMGRGRWPIPVGCWRPAACSSAAST